MGPEPPLTTWLLELLNKIEPKCEPVSFAGAGDGVYLLTTKRPVSAEAQAWIKVQFPHPITFRWVTSDTNSSR